jgi:hypothetical protein
VFAAPTSKLKKKKHKRTYTLKYIPPPSPSTKKSMKKYEVEDIAQF